MPKGYPPEFRRKVLDLLKAGRSVAELARDLQISDQEIYNWRRQELIDTGQMPGITSTEQILAGGGTGPPWATVTRSGPAGRPPT